jgi:ribosomal protein S18 acetylase RimI-like enzyme
MGKDKIIIDYLIENEIFFINILDKFNGNYSKIPGCVGYYPFFDNERINSLIAFLDNGYFYLDIKDKNIKESADFLINNFYKIFSIYGNKETIEKLIILIDKPYRYTNEYLFMKLEKKDFNSYENINDIFICKKCDISDFNDIKDIQYQYHKEEVYSNNSYYPYNAEMNALKDLLKERLVYAVYIKENNKYRAVAKSNVNGESFNYFQLGGIFTQKEYRNTGLSKFCLTNLINDIFSNYDKKGIILYVKRNNIPAINLYKSLGFKTEFETTLCYY